MDGMVPRRRTGIRRQARSLEDGCVWCIREPNGIDILKYMLWSTNPVGIPDVLVFSNRHTDTDDLIRDMERIAEMYGGVLDKRGLKDS